MSYGDNKASLIYARPLFRDIDDFHSTLEEGSRYQLISASLFCAVGLIYVGMAMCLWRMGVFAYATATDFAVINWYIGIVMGLCVCAFVVLSLWIEAQLYKLRKMERIFFVNETISEEYENECAEHLMRTYLKADPIKYW